VESTLLFVEIFDSREIATAFWITLFAIYVVCSAPTRTALVRLIQAAAKPKIVAPIFFAAIILSGVVWILHLIGLWTTAELKDTITWFLLTGVALLFRGINAPHPDRAIHAIVLDAIRLTVFAEFFFSTYTFPLPVELLLLPFATVLAAALALAQTERRYAIAASFLGRLQIALGIVVVGATLWSAAHDLRQLFSIEAARRLLTPIILGFAFIPLAYVMALLAAYEQLFLPLKIYPVRKSLALYTKIRLVTRLTPDLKNIVVAKGRLWTSLGKIANKTDVDDLLEGLSVEIPAPVPPGLDRRSYDAGYDFGIRSASADLETRMKVHEQCDALIVEKSYDQESFDEGFAAGTQDFDLR
jgi:hypothetical protein